MAKTYEPIASHTLTGTTASYTFSSIPGTFTDLVAVAYVQDAIGQQNMYARINSDTGNNYSSTQIYGTGSTANSARLSNFGGGVQLGFTGASSGSEFGITVAHFMSYANTSVYKTVLAAGAIASAYVARRVALWRNTAAITSLTFYCDAASMTSGTTISLYGIKAA